MRSLLLLLVLLASVVGAQLLPISIESGATLHGGILGSAILYFDGEVNEDPISNLGTKGSPTGCDGTATGTAPTHNTTAPLSDTGDWDFPGSGGGRFNVDWTTGNCDEARFGGDACFRVWFDRDSNTVNQRLFQFYDSGAVGIASQVRAQFACGVCGGAAQYCVSAYVDGDWNAGTSVGVGTTGVDHHLTLSYDDTGGEITLYLDGVNVTNDCGTQASRGTPASEAAAMWSEGATPFDGQMDGFFVTNVECSAADDCYLCSCGPNNEEGCTWTGSTWTDPGLRDSACNSCTLPATPSTYTGPS